jgi:hypothetical protein
MDKKGEKMKKGTNPPPPKSGRPGPPPPLRAKPAPVVQILQLELEINKDCRMELQRAKIRIYFTSKEDKELFAKLLETEDQITLEGYVVR